MFWKKVQDKGLGAPCREKCSDLRILLLPKRKQRFKVSTVFKGNFYAHTMAHHWLFDRFVQQTGSVSRPQEAVILYMLTESTLPIRPLFFISLFLVTSARSFRWELKKKKKKKIDHWSWAAKFDLSRTWSCTPTTTSSASEAYRSFASSVAVPVPSLALLRKRFHRSSSLHILCAKNALRRGCVFALEGRSRCAPDCHTRWLTWPGPWLRCVWSQLNWKQKSVLLRACDQMLCEGIGIFFGGEIIIFRLGA